MTATSRISPSPAATAALAALSPDDCQVAGRLCAAVDDPSNTEGLSRSQAARKARTDTDTARRLLSLLAGAGIVGYAGNGAWTRYHRPHP